MSSRASPNSAPHDALSLFTQRHIRVFVSSTSRDMHSEREELVKRIFPQLRKLCESPASFYEQKAEGHPLPSAWPRSSVAVRTSSAC